MSRGGGCKVSKSGRGIFWAKEVFVTLTHVPSVMDFECLGGVRIWDGGVVPKKALERWWSNEVLLVHL